MPTGNFEILHALKCVLVVCETPFCMHTVHTYLQVAICSFRLKSTTYRTLASGLRSSHIR